MYTHTTTTNYECILCKKYFIFPSELDAHMIKHNALPSFSCNIVRCSKSYFRKYQAQLISRHMMATSGHASIKGVTVRQMLPNSPPKEAFK